MKNPCTEIIGTYITTIRKDFSNGYTVFYISCKNYDEYKINGKILCAGRLPITTKGVPLKLIGYFEKTKSDIFLFNVSEASLYSDKKEITCEYILNTKIKGIGPKTAEKIVNITGADIFSFIKRHDALEYLNNALPEVKKDKLERLIETINETHFEKQIYEYLKLFGGDYIHSQTLFEQYQSNAIEELKKNPYKVGKNAGLPFSVCDSIARAQNLLPYANARSKYMVISAMYNITNNGHTVAGLKDVYDEVQHISKNSAFPEIPIPCSVVACSLQNTRAVLSETDEVGDNVYTLREIANAEDVIVKNVTRIINSTERFSCNVLQEIAIVESKFNIEYSSRQREAFEFLLSSGIKILTGGPGTGKTTVVNGLIDAYQRIHPDKSVILCAPTGRAAQKMKEATKHEAFTIHRLLNIKPYEASNTAIDYDDIEHLDAGLIIVDEMSMVDTKLFAYITSAVQEKATIILCGDTFQLPSVGPGNVLNDLISLDILDTVMLDVIHRQKNGSTIVSIAEAVKNGDISAFHKPRKNASDKAKYKQIFGDKELQIIETKDAEQLSETIINTLKKAFFNSDSPFYVDNILDLQILSSTKKYEAGTTQLNKAIKAAYNNEEASEESDFSIGDKIMMIENNYEIGYYNGDVGFIKEINESKGTITVEIDSEEYEIPQKNVKDISLAYACTVHKSQGSEYPYVIIALPKEPISILQRNLIYTAITRAKKYVAIIYEKEALLMAVNRNDATKRRTNLKHKILAKL